MELKDVILSTLAEMEDNVSDKALSLENDFEVKEIKEVTPVKKPEVKAVSKNVEGSSPESELKFLNSMRERLLVLFEGFQAPNNVNIEAKVDLTLNFLEYVLATIDARAELLEKGKR